MSTYTITKDFAFSASHVLHGLPEGHQCGRLHGHNYLVRVSLTCDDLDPIGFVIDFGELAPVKRWIDDVLDHRHLNDVLTDLPNPTAEHMARHIGVNIIPALIGLPPGVTVAVGVRETDKCWAWWSQ